MKLRYRYISDVCRKITNALAVWKMSRIEIRNGKINRAEREKEREMRQFRAYSVNFRKDEEIKTSFSIETTSEYCKTFLSKKDTFCKCRQQWKGGKNTVARECDEKMFEPAKKSFFLFVGITKSKQTHERE